MPAGPGAGEGQGDAFLSFTQELLFTMGGCLSQDALGRAMSSTGNYDATPAGLLAACLEHDERWEVSGDLLLRPLPQHAVKTR